MPWPGKVRKGVKIFSPPHSHKNSSFHILCNRAWMFLQARWKQGSSARKCDGLICIAFLHLNIGCNCESGGAQIALSWLPEAEGLRGLTTKNFQLVGDHLPNFLQPFQSGSLDQFWS